MSRKRDIIEVLNQF